MKRDTVFTYKELTELLKLCKKQGVLEFKLADLSVSFAQGGENDESGSLSTHRKRKAARIQQETLDQENESIREDVFSELAITDPAEYERMIEQGELENARGGEDI